MSLTYTTADTDPERRGEQRQAAKIKIALSLLDGPSAGQVMHLLSNDRSYSGVSFTTPQPLAIGQNCRVTLETSDQVFARFMARVVRQRVMDDGSAEVAVQFRRQIAA